MKMKVAAGGGFILAFASILWGMHFAEIPPPHTQVHRAGDKVLYMACTSKDADMPLTWCASLKVHLEK